MIKQYTIHLPVNFNDGQAVPKELVDYYKSKALDKFGGYTYDGYHMQGAWRDNGKDYIEPMTKLIIASDDNHAVNVFVESIKRAFKQEAMYVAISEVVFM